MEGLEEINQMMIDLRENPLKKLTDKRVIIEDYQSLWLRIIRRFRNKNGSKIECTNLLYRRRI
jgi:hypothetical protein